MINALKVVNKEISEIKVVINGAGAAGTAITKLLIKLGVAHVIMCDSKGIIYENRPVGMNIYKDEIAKITNKNNTSGSLMDALKGADVFIGVSVAKALSKEMVEVMNDDSIIFALANPTPEIFPEEAKAAGANIIATGRSDYPNQVNNVLAFPGIFRGALDVRASEINEEMKIAAAYAIADLISEEELNAEHVIPDPFDSRVATRVAEEVARCAIKTGVARKCKI